MRRHKYNAVRTVVNGITFASRHEAKRYRELLHLQTAGEISNLKCQVRYDLPVNGHKVTSYRPDFQYVVLKGLNRGEVVTEDAKSGPTRTEAYVIRKKLMLAIHQIEIQEV